MGPLLNFVQPIWRDLRAKRLWPVALGLLVAIVAVPIVLSTSSSGPAVGSASSPGSLLPTSGLPAVSVSSGPGGSALNGSAHNPFAPQSGAGGTSTTAASTTTSPSLSPGSSSPAGSSSSQSTGGASTGQSTAPGSSGTTTTPSGPPLPPKIPTGKPKPTSPYLTPTQSYVVSLAITNSHGGVNTINSLERLSPLPSARQPLLVELGVLKGGKRVLFAVQQGTFGSGPGTCVPGPIDCQILSLGQDQTETIGVRTWNGRVREAMFAVTGITAVGHGSASAAMKARQAESSAGRTILNHSGLSALSLFRYEQSVGAVVDLRNLTVGGS
jgi:hypothetical protein